MRRPALWQLVSKQSEATVRRAIFFWRGATFLFDSSRNGIGGQGSVAGLHRIASYMPSLAFRRNRCTAKDREQRLRANGNFDHDSRILPTNDGVFCQVSPRPLRLKQYIAR